MELVGESAGKGDLAHRFPVLPEQVNSLGNTEIVHVIREVHVCLFLKNLQK